MQVSFVRAFQDNYIWIILIEDKAWVVDPGESFGVINFLKENTLNLQGILITHHHWDHTGGVEDILKYKNVRVFNADNVSENDIIQLSPKEYLRVLAIPGHTLDHVAFYNEEVIFCGDTLFAAGCGRVFEGTAEMLFNSLQKIKQLPLQTKIYCGHEYTLKNLIFAQTIEPENDLLKKRKSQVLKLIQKNQNTLPSTLQEELETNPFLRCNLEEFTNIRKLKDNYKFKN